MSAYSKRFLASALLFAALLSLGLPVHARPRPVAAKGTAVRLVSFSGLWDLVVRFVTGSLTKEGVSIDPDGREDEGMSIDPDGRT